MFTDMVGYSALIQKNEMLGIELLDEQRNILRPLFLKYDGREIEAVGDAFFVEFESALEGVRCAVEIQKVLHARNVNSIPENKITLRIGIHVGDVIHVDDRVHGDGVNIAARLEPLARPGGICISEDVARQVENKINLPLKKQSTEKLKNIEHKVSIFYVLLPWETENKKHGNETLYHIYGQKITISIAILLAIITLILLVINFNDPTRVIQTRIAVLPLQNISDESEDEYFADGLTEELISQLAKIGGLNVIAKTSVLKFQDKQTDLEEIGDELNVGSVLTGSVRTFGNKARISVQLINIDKLENIWTEDYDRELRDIFNIQSGIAMKVANELKVKLQSKEKELMSKEYTANPDAYKKYLLGLSNLNRRTMESVYAGLKYFEEAIKIDSNYAHAYVGVADCYTVISSGGYGSVSQEEAISYAHKYIDEALKIDNSLAQAYNTLAYINMRLEWNWNEAEENFQKAIMLEPSFAKAHERYGLLLALLGRNEEALHYMKRAYELDPLSPSVSTGLGRVLHFSRQFDDAIDQFKLTLAMHPNYVEAEFAIGIGYVLVKKYDDAIFYLNRIVEKSKNRYVFLAALGHAYASSGRKEEAIKIYDKLTEFSKKQEVSPLYFAMIDTGLGNVSKAIDLYYQAYEQHFGLLVYIKASTFTDPLKSDPRFQELLKLIGLS